METIDGQGVYYGLSIILNATLIIMQQFSYLLTSGG